MTDSANASSGSGRQMAWRRRLAEKKAASLAPLPPLQVQRKPWSLMWTLVPAMLVMPMFAAVVLVIAPPLQIGLDGDLPPRSLLPSQQMAASSPSPSPAVSSPALVPSQSVAIQQLTEPDPALPSVPPGELAKADIAPPSAELASNRIPEEAAVRAGQLAAVEVSQARGEATAPEIIIAPSVVEGMTQSLNVAPPIAANVTSSASADEIPSPPQEDMFTSLPPVTADSRVVAMVTPPRPAASPQIPLPRLAIPASAPRPAAPTLAAAFLQVRCRAATVRLQLEQVPHQNDLAFLKRGCLPER